MLLKRSPLAAFFGFADLKRGQVHVAILIIETAFSSRVQALARRSLRLSP